MALVDDFSYMLGDDGIILNPDLVAETFVDIENIDGLDNAPIRTTERDHEGTDGGFMDAEYEKGRPITLEGTVYATGAQSESYLDDLKANYAPSRTLVPFYFKQPGVDERVIFVKPLGCRYNINSVRRLGRTEIQFQMYAEDPRIYDSALQNIDIPQGEVIETGLGYSYAYPFSYGVAVTPNGQNIEVGGNRPTPVIFTMAGPVTNPEIVNDNTGDSLKFIIDVGASDQLVVDTYRRTVKLNGQNRRSTLQNPNWFFLEPGNNYIRYRAESVGPSNLNIQFRFARR